MRLEYAITNNQLVHISKVAERNRCHCPSCGQTLIPHKHKNRHHQFFHKQTECNLGVEKTLCLLIQDILKVSHKLHLPKVNVDLNLNPEAPEATTISQDLIIRVKDISIHTGKNTPYLTVFTERKKLILLPNTWKNIPYVLMENSKNSRVSVLAINLVDRLDMPDKDELKIILEAPNERKVWAYNNLANHYRETWLDACQILRISHYDFRLQTENCPIKMTNNPHVNTYEDCLICPYNMLIDERNIWCSGRNKISSVTELKNYLRQTSH